MTKVEFLTIVNDYREVYHTFEKYEARPWNAEANLIELYKQIGEMINTKLNDPEQYKDEVLDVLCQIVRLIDYYKYDVEKVYDLSKNIDLDNDLLLSMIENIGNLSKCIMLKEKYYFKSRIYEPKYSIKDEDIIKIFATHIGYILKIAEVENIDLIKVSENTRRIDKEYFPIIEKNESKYKKISD